MIPAFETKGVFDTEAPLAYGAAVTDSAEAACEVCEILEAASRSLQEHHSAAVRALERLSSRAGSANVKMVESMNHCMAPCWDEAQEAQEPSSLRHELSNGTSARGNHRGHEKVPLRGQPAADEHEAGTAKTEARSAVSAHKKAQSGSRRKFQEDLEKQRSRESRGLFADIEKMKKKVKESMMKPPFNVHDLYQERGFFQMVAKHRRFELATLLVITLNAIWLAVEIDYNTEKELFKSPVYIIVIENMFCVYFFMEVFIRFMAFRYKTDIRKDMSFVFDGLLVIMMVVETWIIETIVYCLDIGGSGGSGGSAMTALRLLRILRLTRIARIGRLLREAPEMMIIIRGMFVASRAVVVTLALLVLIVYVFSIAFVQLTDGYDDIHDEYFSTVSNGMSTLVFGAALPDAELVSEIGAVNFLLGALMMLFILVSTLTLLNMLTGILVDVITAVSVVEKEEMMMSNVRHQVSDLLSQSDGDGDMMISRAEFEDLLLLPQGAGFLQDLGVDPVGIIDFVDHIFDNNEEISFEAFMDLILTLRGQNAASVKDFVDMRRFVKEQLQLQSQILAEQLAAALPSILAEKAPAQNAQRWRRKQAVAAPKASSHSPETECSPRPIEETE